MIIRPTLEITPKSSDRCYGCQYLDPTYWRNEDHVLMPNKRRMSAASKKNGSTTTTREDGNQSDQP